MADSAEPVNLERPAALTILTEDPIGGDSTARRTSRPLRSRDAPPRTCAVERSAFTREIPRWLQPPFSSCANAALPGT